MLWAPSLILSPAHTSDKRSSAALEMLVPHKSQEFANDSRPLPCIIISTIEFRVSSLD